MIYILASTAIFFGQLLRSLKLGIILREESLKSTKQGVLGLSISYFFDFILPFKFGIIFRSFAMSKMGGGSYSFFTYLIIFIFERILDIYLLTFLILIFIPWNVSNNNKVIIVFLFLLLNLIIFTNLVRRIIRKKFKHSKKRISWSGRVISFIAFLSKNFRTLNAEKLVNEYFSVNQIFNKTKTDKYRIFRYLLMHCASWFMILFGIYIFSVEAEGGDLIDYQRNILTAIDLMYLNIGLFKIILYVPFSTISFFAIYVKRKQIMNYFRNLSGFMNNSDNSYTSMLKSLKDESYIIDKYIENLENKTEIDILRGGSKAIIVKYDLNNKKFVDKIVSIQNKNELERQILWLKNNKFKYSPTVIKTTENDLYFSYQMNYIEGADFFEYIHVNKLKKSIKIIDQIFLDLDQDLYTPVSKSKESRIIIDYFDSKIIKNLRQIAKQNSKFDYLINSNDGFSINGNRSIFFNNLLSRVYKKLEKSNESSYLHVSKEIHGDLTIENIRISKDQYFLIDPSNNSQLSGPLIDIGRLLQSLEGGHEFINRNIYNLETNEKASELNFKSIISPQYLQLSKHVRQNLVPRYLYKNEAQYLDLIIASFFTRMIMHSINVSEQLSLLYFAKAVHFLSRYLNEEQ
jgi:hypothetical protein